MSRITEIGLIFSHPVKSSLVLLHAGDKQVFCVKKTSCPLRTSEPCECVYLCVHEYASLGCALQVYVYAIWVCMCMHVHLCVCVFVCPGTCVHLHVRVYICVYIYTLSHEEGGLLNCIRARG